MAGNGTVLGTVVRWDDARGGGVIEALEVPGGCWADESVVVHGGGGLRAGQVVEFDRAEPGEAGFPFRALRVLPGRTAGDGRRMTVRPSPARTCACYVA